MSNEQNVELCSVPCGGGVRCTQEAGHAGFCTPRPCTRPPIGWKCTRGYHADGPCAAIPDDNLTITQGMRNHQVSHTDASKAAHRLINSHFGNKDQARVSIPVKEDDDDVLVCDYVREQAVKEAERITLADEVLQGQLSVINLPFQEAARGWCVTCLGREEADRLTERNNRFLEECIELFQLGGTREDAHALVDYVYDRPAGDELQEVGGVMLTLATLCTVIGVDMNDAAHRELLRVWTKMPEIRKKHASKPRNSPLPSSSNNMEGTK